MTLNIGELKGGSETAVKEIKMVRRNVKLTQKKPRKEISYKRNSSRCTKNRIKNTVNGAAKRRIRMLFLT